MNLPENIAIRYNNGLMQNKLRAEPAAGINLFI